MRGRDGSGERRGALPSSTTRTGAIAAAGLLLASAVAANGAGAAAIGEGAGAGGAGAAPPGGSSVVPHDVQ